MDSPTPVDLRAPTFRREISDGSVFEEMGFVPQHFGGLLFAENEDLRRSRSTSSWREHASPAMTNSDRDHIMRCMETLRLYESEMVSFDARAAVKDALDALEQNFANIRLVSDINEQVEALKEVIKDDYPDVEDLHHRMQVLLSAFDGLIEDVTSSSDVAKFAQSQFKKASEEI